MGTNSFEELRKLAGGPTSPAETDLINDVASFMDVDYFAKMAEEGSIEEVEDDDENNEDEEEDAKDKPKRQLMNKRDGTGPHGRGNGPGKGEASCRDGEKDASFSKFASVHEMNLNSLLQNEVLLDGFNSGMMKSASGWSTLALQIIGEQE